MKSLAIIWLSLPFLGISQEKIKGIGPFKIGETTTSILGKISQDVDVKVKKSTKYIDVKKGTLANRTDLILELSIDEDDKYSAHPAASKLPEQTSYYINYYEVSGVPLKEVVLRFWNDTLYEFQCSANNEVTEAVSSKYGEPETQVDKKTISCRSGLGIQFTETEKSFYSTWKNTESGISCFAIVAERFDSKCKPYFTSNFKISDRTLFMSILDKEMELSDKKRDAENKEKKKSLTDF